MSEEKVVEKVEEPKASAMDEIFNKKISFIVGNKNVQVWRMSVETLEMATATVLKLILMFQPGRPLFNILSSEDIAIFRKVLASCSSINEDEFRKLPPSAFLKVADKWLEVNEDELMEASKLFFGLKERVTKLGEKLVKK